MKTLTWKNIWEDLELERDKGGRWYTVNGTPAAEYIEENGYRSPSRSWPHSHAKPLLTRKFAKWLLNNHNKFAISLDLE